MKNLFLVILLSIFTNSFAQKIQFPENFKYDPHIIPEMKIAKITDEAREHGIFKNPAVLTSKEEMQAVVDDYDLENVTRVYIEFYEEIKKDNRDDAGIVVTEFNSKESLEAILPTLYPQSNYIFMTLDKYLILVWNDGRNSDERLRKSIDYYQKKLGAKEFIATREYENSGETVIDNSATEVRMETMVAPLDMLTEMGFGTVRTDLFTPAEIRTLHNYISNFERNYDTQIAIENIGLQDLTEEMVESYASHLVFNDEARIKNNMVILFDEIKHTSWIYFGTENGKILNKLPIEKLKNDFNKNMQKGDLFIGLYDLLAKLEFDLIEASGR